MGVWITILLLVLQYGPTIWKLVKEIIDLINGVAEHLPLRDRRDYKKLRKIELDSAVNYYKMTKDKSKLESMHGELTVQLMNLEAGGRK